MVLLLVGLLLGGLLQPWGSALEQQRRKESWRQLRDIRETLYAHAAVHGRLPCPDCRQASGGTCTAASMNDGVEDASPQGCASAVGNLPWSTLALPRRDAWGHDYTYRVSIVFARPLSACQAKGNCVCNAMQAAFTLCDEAQLSISNAPGAAGNVGRNLPAVVVSHGGNHLRADQGRGEIDNYEGAPHYPHAAHAMSDHARHDRPAQFVWQNPVRRAGSVEFDDLLIWLSPFVLKTRMVQAGRLP